MLIWMNTKVLTNYALLIRTLQAQSLPCPDRARFVPFYNRRPVQPTVQLSLHYSKRLLEKTKGGQVMARASRNPYLQSRRAPDDLHFR